MTNHQHLGAVRNGQHLLNIDACEHTSGVNERGIWKRRPGQYGSIFARAHYKIGFPFKKKSFIGGVALNLYQMADYISNTMA